MNADEIKNYIVKIDYNKPNKGLQLGSGVVVTLDGENSYFYIFSAKHTFFNKEFELNEKRDTQIKLSNPDNSFTQEVYNVEVVWCKKDYDFIVFKLINDYDFKLAPLSISNDEEFSNCIIYGYPYVSKDNKAPHYPIECKYSQIHNDYEFYVSPYKQFVDILDGNDYNNTLYIKGLSGAGVFVSNHHIIAIQIEGASANELLCFDLRIIIDDLNQDLVNRLLKPIKTEGLSISDQEFDIPNINLDDIQKKLKNDYIDQIIQSGEDITFLKNNKNSYYNGLRKQDNALKELMQKMADTYLYHGIIFHKHGFKSNATRNFNKAICLSSEHKAYFAQALLERKNEELEKNKKHNGTFNQTELEQLIKSKKDGNIEELTTALNEFINKSLPTPIEIKVLDKAINIPSKEIIKKDYKKYDLLQEIEKNKDNPLKLIELKKLYIGLLDKEEDKEEILKLELEIAELLIAHKNIILKKIESLFTNIDSDSNKRDDFVKKIDEIQKDKDTIIDLNAHLHKIKEEFIASLKNTVNQETLTESLNSIDKKIGEIQNPVIPEEIKGIPNAIEALSNEMKDMKESSNNAMNQQFDKIDKTSDSIKGVISDNSNEILKGIDSNHNQQTILTIGLLFVLSILVFVLVFILIFFTD